MSAHSLVPETMYNTTPLRLSSYATQKMNTNKHKRQLSRDGRAKTHTRVIGIITNEMHPYTFFIETLLLENKL